MKRTFRLIWIFVMAAIIGGTAASCNKKDKTGGERELSGSITISPPVAPIGTDFTAIYGGSETVSYQWKKAGTDVGTNANKYTPTEAGNYTVTVSATGYNSKTSAVANAVDPGQSNPNNGSDHAINAVITYPLIDNPIVWGYDVKQPESANGFTVNLAKGLFEEDGMGILRVPIFLNYYNESDRTVMENHSKVQAAMAAIQTAVQVKSDVKIFASLKIEGMNGTGVNGNEGTFPAWAYNSAPIPTNNPQNGYVKADVYIDMLVNFFLYMKKNNITIHYLAVDNEPEHSCSGFDRNYDLYIEVIDGLKSKFASLEFEMPQLVAPEPLGPKEEHINFVKYIVDTKKRGDLIDIVGTHYYPIWRWNNANLQSRLKRIADAGQGRPLWNTEAHYDALDQIKKAENWTELDRANQFMVTNFDCFDLGCNGYFIWAYRRADSDLKGSICRQLAQSTADATHAPIDINPVGKNAVDCGFNIRAFVKNKTVTVWITNMKDKDDPKDNTKTGYTLAINGETIKDDATFLIWTDSSWSKSPYSPSTGNATVSTDRKYITFTIPDRSMSLLTFNIN